MADESGTAAAGPQEGAAQEGGDPQGSPVDWEARYREMRAHSREWEKKARANEAAAAELEKLKEASMTAEQKAAAKADALQKELDGYKRAEERRAWAKSVSEGTGVPAEVLEAMSADSEEELRERAESLSGYFKAAKRQVVPGDGVQPPAGARTESGNDWLRSTLPQSMR